MRIEMFCKLKIRYVFENVSIGLCKVLQKLCSRPRFVLSADSNEYEGPNEVIGGYVCRSNRGFLHIWMHAPVRTPADSRSLSTCRVNLIRHEDPMEWLNTLIETTKREVIGFGVFYRWKENVFDG